MFRAGLPGSRTAILQRGGAFATVANSSLETAQCQLFGCCTRSQSSFSGRKEWEVANASKNWGMTTSSLSTARRSQSVAAQADLGTQRRFVSDEALLALLEGQEDFGGEKEVNGADAFTGRPKDRLFAEVGEEEADTETQQQRRGDDNLNGLDLDESVTPLGRYFVCPLTHPEAAAKEAASNATSSEFAKKMLQDGKGPSDGVFGPDATRAEIKAYLAEKFVGETTPAQPEDKSAIPPPRVTCSCCSSEFYSVKSFVDHFDFDKCYLPCKRLGREVESPFSNHVFTADQTPAQVYNHILHKHWQANPFQPRATLFKCPSCLQGFKSFDKLMDHLNADWQCGADFEALDPNARKGKAPEVMPHDLRCPYGAPSSVPDHATIQRDFKKGTPAKAYWDYFVKYHWKEDPAKPRSEPFYCVCGLGYYDFDEYRRHLKWPHKAMCLRPNYLPANWTGPYKAELLPMEQRMKHLVFEAETKEAELAEQHAVNREYAMSEWEKEDQKFAEELAAAAAAAAEAEKAKLAAQQKPAVRPKAADTSASSVPVPDRKKKRDAFPPPPSATPATPPPPPPPTAARVETAPPPPAPPAPPAAPKAATPPQAATAKTTDPSKPAAFVPPVAAKKADLGKPTPVEKKKTEAKEPEKKPVEKKKKKARLGRFT